MPITITSEINPILHCNRNYHRNTQCRIGLISEVIVIGIVNPIPLFQSLSCHPILSFFPKTFLHLFLLLFLSITIMDEPALHNDYVTLLSLAINYCY